MKKNQLESYCKKCKYLKHYKKFNSDMCRKEPAITINELHEWIKLEIKAQQGRAHRSFDDIGSYDRLDYETGILAGLSHVELHIHCALRYPNFKE